MTVFDVSALVIIILFGLLGFRKGVLYELLLLGLTAVVFLVSYFITPYLLEFLNKFVMIDEREVFPALFSVLLCLSVSLLGGIIALLGKVEKPTIVSRGIGAALGIFLGILFTGMILWMCASFIPGVEENLMSGEITKRIMSVVTVVYGFLENLIRDNNITPFTIMNYKI
jgi:uncharacterized membrane protein required for colicin V production